MPAEDALSPAIDELSALSERLRVKPAAERRIALVLPAADVDDASLRSAIAILVALRDDGYRAGAQDAASLAEQLREVPTATRPYGPAEETLSFAEYSAFCAVLPPPVQQRMAERWGSAERDPLFRPGRLDCGHFMIAAVRLGNIAVLREPSPGFGLDPDALTRGSLPTPPHGHLAMCAWINEGFRADAVIDIEGGRIFCPAVDTRVSDGAR